MGERAAGSGTTRRAPLRGVTSVLYDEAMPPLTMPERRSKTPLRNAFVETFDDDRGSPSAARQRSGPGRIWLPHGPKGLTWSAEVAIGWTAAVADSCDALVVEDTHGWSAVEPFPACWRRVPGACWFWRATFVDRLGSKGLVIDHVPACTAKTLEEAQGKFGWMISVERAGRLVEISFRHPMPGPDRGLQAVSRTA